MPYRRLPNTDTARIRALRTALGKGRDLPPGEMAFSPKIIVRLQGFLPKFEQGIMLHRQYLANQSTKSRDYTEAARKSRLYLTHFIRVMNMAVLRGDLPSETRAFYGLPTNDFTTPALRCDKELVTWGKRIIEGEENRIRKGGCPITNPTIAVVKVWYHSFMEARNFHKSLSARTLDLIEKSNCLRKEADEIILQIWNEVESKYSNLSEEDRIAGCEDYGLVYFYRKNEQEKAAMMRNTGSAS